MGPEPTKAFATRLSADEAELIEAVIEETGWLKSDLVRRAVQHYMVENPDNVRVLTPDDFTSRILAELEK